LRAAAASFAPASFAFCFWPRKTVYPIAARMPMIITTTSSSTSVNPRSDWSRRLMRAIIKTILPSGATR